MDLKNTHMALRIQCKMSQQGLTSISQHCMLEQQCSVQQCAKWSNMSITSLAEHLMNGACCLQGDLPRMIINRSVELMLQELEPNFWEAELYRLVDFGHSFSPHLEMEALASDFPLLHGEAVAIDMALSTCISLMRGLISQRDHDRTLQLLIAYRLPIWHGKMTPESMQYGLESTTRGRDGLQRLPLATGELGNATFINDLSHEEVTQALANLRSYAQTHSYAPELC